MVIHLVAGHDDIRDPGAVSTHPILKKLKESELNIEFKNLLSLELDKLNIEHTKDDDTLPLRTVIANLNKSVKKHDLMIDIHFNAGPPTATGTEVIIKGNPNKFERKIAGQIVEVISEKLKIRNRGVKTESSTARGRIGILHVPCNTILLELCFLTNTNDMDNYTKWKFILASAIADIIKKI